MQANPVPQGGIFFAPKPEPSQVAMLPLRSTYLQVLPRPAQLNHRGTHQVTGQPVLGDFCLQPSAKDQLITKANIFKVGRHKNGNTYLGMMSLGKYLGVISMTQIFQKFL